MADSGLSSSRYFPITIPIARSRSLIGISIKITNELLRHEMNELCHIYKNGWFFLIGVLILLEPKPAAELPRNDFDSQGL